MERPDELAGADVVGANIAGRRRQRFRIAAAHDQEIFVDNSRAGERDGWFSGSRPRSLRRSMRPFSPKVEIGFPVSGIERINRIHYAGQDAFFLAIAPVGQAAGGLPSLHRRDQTSTRACRWRRSGQSLFARRVRVEHTADDDRAGLQSAGFAGVETPGNLQLLYILAIDLSQGRVVVIFRSAAIDRPIVLLGGCVLHVGREEKFAIDQCPMRRSRWRCRRRSFSAMSCS